LDLWNLMLTTIPYNPTTQDLFLYEDLVISWTEPTPGTTTVKRPYAWNPNCPLYAYRRSLEGLVAPYRTFSTENINPNPEVNAVNPKSNPVNRPMWWNSFPPTAKVISPRMMHWCAHAYGFDNPVYGDRVAGQMLSTLYAPNTYLSQVFKLRFIDGDNNITEIPLDQCELPYSYDSTNGIVSPYGTGSPWNNDVASAILSQTFPFNPVTLVDAGSISPKVWTYINAGNMYMQEIYFRSVGFRNVVGASGGARNLRGNHVVYANYYDQAFTHDSGSVFMTEIRPPTSAAEGDGVMGIALGHLEFPPPDQAASEVWVEGVAPFKYNGVGISPARNPAFPQKVDAAYSNFLAYWTARGHQFPEIAEGSWAASYTPVTQTQAQSIQTIAAAMRSSSFS
jgi:hypothetical protein